MDKEESLTQQRIDEVWSEEWSKREGSANALFAHRLFIEAYPIFKQYIKKGTKELVELGAGSGRYGLKFATEFPDTQIVITDIVDESLRLVDRYATELGLQNVRTQKEDVLHLSFPDDSIELLFCDAVLQHIPDAEAAAKEMMRVLAPGGTLIISSVNGHNPFHAIFRAVIGERYHYGYEYDFTARELATIFGRYGGRTEAVDGFYLAYGLYRLKYEQGVGAPRFYDVSGRIVNRLVKSLDRLTGRFLSRHFGFETFVVVRKEEK